MSSANNSIFIENIGIYTSPLSLANLFNDCNIAILKQVTIFPEYDAKKKQLNHSAYITVEWLDTERAYSFINCIKNPLKEARLFYTETDYWVVKKNPMPLFAPSRWTITFESPATKILNQLEEEEQMYLMEDLMQEDQTEAQQAQEDQEDQQEQQAQEDQQEQQVQEDQE